MLDKQKLDAEVKKSSSFQFKIQTFREISSKIKLTNYTRNDQNILLLLTIHNLKFFHYKQHFFTSGC